MSKLTIYNEGSHLYAYDLPALEAQVAAWGHPREHAREIWRWLYRRCATSAQEMATLPAPLRARLAAETTIPVPDLLAHEEAPDGATRKDLLQMADGEQVEVVTLRYRERYSACISTQVGCACGCRFCATGQMGFVRDLSAPEIVAQVLHVQRALRAQGKALSNFVLMGMGEPLLNYENTIAAVRRLLDPRGAGFPPRRVTLSTAGIPPGIRRLADDDLRINLAVSLHAATDALRSRLMPINRRYPLDALFAALREYAERTGKRVMFEWTLIEDLNDTPEEAAALAERLSNLPSHVNLLLLNPTAAFPGRPAPPERVDAFAAVLDRHGIPHTHRQRRGGSIAAGCGQLRARERGG